MTVRRNVNTESITRFLVERGWSRGEVSNSFVRFAPPVELGFADSYRLVLPVTGIQASDLGEFLCRSLEIISEIYSMPIDHLVSLLERKSIFSVRLCGEESDEGKVSVDKVQELSRQKT